MSRGKPQNSKLKTPFFFLDLASLLRHSIHSATGMRSKVRKKIKKCIFTMRLRTYFVDQLKQFQVPYSHEKNLIKKSRKNWSFGFPRLIRTEICDSVSVVKPNKAAVAFNDVELY